MEEHLLAKNNPTDSKAYFAFMADQKSKEKELEIKAKQLRTKRNLQIWNDKYPDYKDLSLSNFKSNYYNLTVPPLSNNMLRTPSFMVASKSAKLRDAFVNSVIKACLAQGIITPSEVEFTTAADGAAHINGMFASREWKARIFNPKNKVIVIEDTNADPYQINEKDNTRFWGTITNFCEVNEIALIISYRPKSTNKLSINAGGPSKSVIYPVTTDVKSDIHLYGRLKMGFIDFTGLKREDVFNEN